ncbi:cyclin-O protein B-like [Lithobates pipiens]
MNPCVEPYNLHSLRRDLQYLMEYGNESYAYNSSIEHYFLPDNCLSHTELDEEDRRKMLLRLIKSHSKHSLSLESLCLAINYRDRLLLNLTVKRSTYNIMAITSMVLALKISETYTKEVHQLIQNFRTYYTNTTMWTMESMIMRELRYWLIAPITNFFLDLIMKRMASAEFTAQTVKENHMLMGCAKAVVKLCLTEYYYCSIPPSLQAICCVKADEWVLFPDKTVTITGVQGYPNERVQEVLEYTITLIRQPRLLQQPHRI